MMSRKLIVLVVTAVVMMLVPACGGGGDDAASSGGDSADALKVIFMVNGVLGDKSFFDSAQRGLDQAEKELGVQTKTVETAPDDVALWEATLIDLAENEEYDIFIVGTWQISHLMYVNALVCLVWLVVGMRMPRPGNVKSMTYSFTGVDYVSANQTLDALLSVDGVIEAVLIESDGLQPR